MHFRFAVVFTLDEQQALNLVRLDAAVHFVAPIGVEVPPQVEHRKDPDVCHRSGSRELLENAVPDRQMLSKC